MPAIHTPSSAAVIIVRFRSVSRQCIGTASFTMSFAITSPSRDDRRCGQVRWHDAFEHDRFVVLRRDQMKAGGREVFDAFRRAQCLDLEPQPTGHLLLSVFFLLELFDSIAV